MTTTFTRACYCYDVLLLRRIAWASMCCLEKALRRCTASLRTYLRVATSRVHIIPIYNSHCYFPSHDSYLLAPNCIASALIITVFTLVD